MVSMSYGFIGGESFEPTKVNGALSIAIPACQPFDGKIDKSRSQRRDDTL